MNPLREVLRKYWGHAEFRPRQEQVIQAILAGRDAAVVMPTGGGKSLCYQLPAVVMQKTCVVISPLISLMQDQAASLKARGVSAACLNSTLDAGMNRDVIQQTLAGQLRLLYLSPERLLRGDLLEWLRRVPIGFFAVDEAHCISEWGHEFRPEYRRLRALKDMFPEVPVAAFTASATRQVRHDIVAQLGLRDPCCSVTSFHRPNLNYVARQCTAAIHEKLILQAVEAYPKQSLIFYAPTIRGVEELQARLSSRGLPAVAYHGQMSPAQRQKNQELWMSGKKPILAGTVAFGMGINKPDVRAVIHLALPKSLEQYYQEAGRAGRDGEPADCVLLWQKKDAALLAHFNYEIEDPAERNRAWQRYRVMRRFAEESICRHRQICLHFGETPKWQKCGVCDVCGVDLSWTKAKAPRKAAKRRKTK